MESKRPKSEQKRPPTQAQPLQLRAGDSGKLDEQLVRYIALKIREMKAQATEIGRRVPEEKSADARKRLIWELYNLMQGVAMLEYFYSTLVQKGVVIGNCHRLVELFTLSRQIDELPPDAKDPKPRDSSAQLESDIENIKRWNGTLQQLNKQVPIIISGQPSTTTTETLRNIFERICAPILFYMEEVQQRLEIPSNLRMEIAVGGKILVPDNIPADTTSCFCRTEDELENILIRFSQQLFPGQCQTVVQIMPLLPKIGSNNSFYLHSNGHSISIATTADGYMHIADQQIYHFPRTAHRQIAECIFDTRRQYYIVENGAKGFLFKITLRKPLKVIDAKASEMKASPMAYPLPEQLYLAQDEDAFTREQRGTLLLLALQANDITFATRLLQSDIDVNVVDTLEAITTPLHLAAASGNSNLVELLLKKGAKINFQDSLGNTPLSLAAYNRHFQVVRLLLSLHASLLIANKFGYSAMQVSTVQLCLFYQSLAKDNSATATTARLALFYQAVSSDDIEFIATLLTEHPQLLEMVNYEDKKILNVLFSPTFSLDSFSALFSHAPQLLRYTNQQHSLLYLAVNAVVEKISRGEDTAKDAEKIYWLATQMQDIDSLKTALNQLFKYYIEQTSYNPLNLRTAVAMLYFFDTLTFDTSYFTRYHISLLPQEDQYSALMNLLAMLEEDDEDRASAINFAAFQYALVHNPAMRDAMLIEDPDIINQFDEDGNTLLHLAAMQGQENAVDFLLAQQGINARARNKDKKLPYEVITVYFEVDTRIKEKLIQAARPMVESDIARSVAESKLLSPKPEQKAGSRSSSSAFFSDGSAGAASATPAEEEEVAAEPSAKKPKVDNSEPPKSPTADSPK